MGAKRFVATTAGFEKDLQRELDLIIVTASSSLLPLGELLSTLDVQCKLVFVGMPEEGLSNVTSQTLSSNGAALTSSHLGSKPEVLRMLKLAADKKIKPWINVMPMKEAAKAIKAVEDNSVRYRSVLTQVSWAPRSTKRWANAYSGYRGVNSVVCSNEPLETDIVDFCRCKSVCYLCKSVCHPSQSYVQSSRSITPMPPDIRRTLLES